MIVRKEFEENEKHLIFKTKDGKVVGTGVRKDGRSKFTETRVYIIVSNDLEAETVDKSKYDEEERKLKGKDE